jgi:hypothetical protein
MSFWGAVILRTRLQHTLYIRDRPGAIACVVDFRDTQIPGRFQHDPRDSHRPPARRSNFGGLPFVIPVLDAHRPMAVDSLNKEELPQIL